MILLLLSDIWKSGADVKLDGDNLDLINHGNTPQSLIDQAIKQAAEIEKYLKSWKSESGENILVMQSIKLFCGWQWNANLNTWLCSDEQALSTFDDWCISLAHEGWSIYTDFREFETAESNALKKQYAELAKTYKKRSWYRLIHYKYTDKELKEILKTLTIIYDTREKQNVHILNYLIKNDVPVKELKRDTGDYSAFIPANETLGIKRDIYFNAAIERKASIDELVGNLLKDKRTAFENELIRSQSAPFMVLVEEQDGYNKIVNGHYRSQYSVEALVGTLRSLEIKYNFRFVFLDQEHSGHYIYTYFYYLARNYLKNGVI